MYPSGAQLKPRTIKVSTASSHGGRRTCKPWLLPRREGTVPLVEKRQTLIGVFAGMPAGDLSTSCLRAYNRSGVATSLMAPISPPVVGSVDFIGVLIDSLIDRLKIGNPEATGLLPQRSQGRSALLQRSAQPGTSWQEMRREAQSAASRPWVPGGSLPGHSHESAFKVHRDEAGFLQEMASTICTTTWVLHPLRALVVCLKEDTQDRYIDWLKHRWLEVAPTTRGKPADGRTLEFAVVTVQQLREGIPLTQETALLPPEKLPGGPLRPRAFREVFLARDLSESGDARAILEAVGRAQLGLQWISPS